MTETESEETLVERAKEDPVAFGVLYKKYVKRIYNYIYCRTGNRHDAEDLTSRTFHRALANIDRYQSKGLPFSAWLYRIAHNLVANWLRDRSRHPVIPFDELVSTRPHGRRDLVYQAEVNEEREALLEAIRRLHSDRQQLLVLKLMEGMSNAEIGQVLGRSVGAIKSLYFRTLIDLREDLENRGF
ncbi:MAG: sigma-70 family RNA polymerase sigma factor [Anaerolineales bacterium]|nr:sigma-70 family RNA polymerase sigma factor [Anaerolineales bacterium]